MTITPDQARKTMDNYIKAWGSNDKALLLSLFTEDAILEDPVGTPAFKGSEGVAKVEKSTSDHQGLYSHCHLRKFLAT